MMVAVLGITLDHTRTSNLQQLAVSETVVLNILNMLSRVALFTEEYADLQPYVEEIVTDPHVMQVYITDQNGRIVVSSNTEDVGRSMPVMINKDSRVWHRQEISNASGVLGNVAIKFSHAHLDRTNREALDMGIIIALAGMSIIAIVGLLIGFFMTRKLEKLTLAAQRMADGELDVVCGIRGKDEFAIVGRAFDDMADSIKSYVSELHDSQDALRTAHDELEQRIEERTRELAIARDQADEASRAKSAFLANMSHELRTPLNAIIGYADIIMEEASDRELDPVVPDVRNIRDAGSHLLHLINDILDLSKIEAGKVEFNIAETDIRDMLQAVVVAVQPMIIKNANELLLEVPDDIGSMKVDELKLRQSLLNLLGNAAKFTKQGTITLQVKAYSHDGKPWLDFAVIDTGIGIPEEKLHTLFHEFSQVDNTTTRSYQGTGLGLTISKKLCAMMGGDIAVRSAAGAGCVFTINIPREVSHPLQYHATPLAGKQYQALARRQTPDATRPVARERRSRIARVLVIDNDRHMTNILTRMLSREGFEVIDSDNGTSGVEAARRIIPDAIILDVMLSDTDGWSVLKQLKSDETTGHIPVIILTMAKDDELGISRGASHIIHKPLDQDRMLALLRECVRNV